MVRTHVSAVFGACVLASGVLLAGSGGIAAAAPDSTGSSSTGASGDSTSSTSSSSSSSTDSGTATTASTANTGTVAPGPRRRGPIASILKTLHDLSTVRGPGQKRSPQPAAGPTSAAPGVVTASGTSTVRQGDPSPSTTSTAASDSSSSPSSSSTAKLTTPAADSSTPAAADSAPAAATVAADTVAPDETSSTPASAATTRAEAAVTVAATTTKPDEGSSPTSATAAKQGEGSSTPTEGASSSNTATTFAAATDPANDPATQSSTTTSAATTASTTRNATATFDPMATPLTDAVQSFVNAVAQLPSVLQPIAPGLVEPLMQLMAQIPKLLAPVLNLMADVEVIVRSVVHALVPNWGVSGAIPEMSMQAKGLMATWTTAIATVAPAVMPAAGELPRTFITPLSGPAAALTPQLLSAPFGIAVAPPQATAPASTPSPLANLPGQIAQALREALRTVSLAELALAALPGLAGLLVFFATGVRIGHRQAKFGFAMEMTGIMRFAPAGPLGVVRTGSFIAVSPKKAAAVAVEAQPKARRGRRHLELVA